MRVSRRNFLKYCAGSAAALGLDLSLLAKLETAIADGGGAVPPVIWLNGANCTGCTISLSNLIGNGEPTDVADLLINHIDLAFHPNLMGAAGELAVQTLEKAASGEFILAMDGGIPTAFDGHTCILWTDNNGNEVTAKDAVLNLAPRAIARLSIGTCSSFGGIPSGNPNPTGIMSMAAMTGLPTINIPGCPTHPDWIVWTVVQLLAGVMPELDGDGRPAALFKGEECNVHKRCPRKGEEAKTFGVEGRCLKELGCKGPRTQADCPTRQWNNGTNWCIGANSVCLGCTERDFPDRFSPFYRYSGYSGTSSNLEISKAEWRADIMELKVEGQGEIGAKVDVTDDGMGVLLGSATVNSDGKWKFILKNPDTVPCGVRAESNGQDETKDVKNAPAYCEDVPPSEDTNLQITKSEWRAKRSELKVDGKGDSGSVVLIKNVKTEATLGATSVGREGKWKFRQKDPSSVPCRVLARSNGHDVEAKVKNAPSTCD